MKKALLYFLLCMPFWVIAQDEGIRFENGLSWQQIKAKAKAENKYIFMDCFATWCAPCKSMERFIFPVKEVGDFFNSNFINVKVQLDSTAKDNAEVKAWYITGKEIANSYSVQSFPTYLFFSPDGEIVHRVNGASSKPEEFIALAAASLDTSTQYYTLIKKFEKGDRDVDLLKKGAQTALENSDYNTAAILFNEYLATEKNIFTKENLEFATTFTKTSEGKGFELFLKNSSKIDAILGKGASDNIIMPIIAREEIYTKIKTTDSIVPDWAQIQDSILEKYPQKKPEISRMISWSQVMFYQANKDWENYAKAATSYMKSYSEFADAKKLNELAWHILVSVNTDQHLKNALQWSKKSVAMDKEKNPVTMHTYAGLLYRLGQNKQAIAMEEKAIALMPEVDRVNFTESLDKMKKGEKFW